jgi:hypothetical protein
MESMVAAVLLGLPEWWGIGRVTEPYLSKPNQTEYLTCEISVSRMFTLTTDPTPSA